MKKVLFILVAIIYIGCLTACNEPQGAIDTELGLTPEQWCESYVAQMYEEPITCRTEFIKNDNAEWLKEYVNSTYHVHTSDGKTWEVGISYKKNGNLISEDELRVCDVMREL